DFACDIHTHPIVAGVAAKWITQDKGQELRAKNIGPSIPPSPQDVSPVASLNRQTNVGNVIIVNAVIDPRGIWYHRTAKETDYAEFPEFANQITSLRTRQEELFGNLTPDNRGFIGEALKKLDIQTLAKIYEPADPTDTLNTAMNEYEHGPTQSDERNHMEEFLFFHIIMNTPAGQRVAGEILTPEELKRYAEYQNDDFEMKKEDHHLLNTVHQEWIDATSKGEFPESVLVRVRESLLRQGSFSRFVTHEEALKEPPCAGADYKPAL
ncbi:MAG: hypothetical protein ACI9VM_000957, partial [Candidatus Azotimanducaceae bacterium]